MPLVSIIVPVYNVEAYLDKCVNSLVNQTLEDIEIILVDDGSPDACPAMCDAWAQKDKRIQVIHKQNGGLSSARNAALKVCTGAYIGFVDSDDYADEKMFEALYKSAQIHGADIAVCAHYTDDGTQVTAHALPFEKTLYTKEEIPQNFIIPLIGQDKSKTIPAIEGFIWRQLFQKELIENMVFRSEKEFFAEDVVFDFEVYPLCQTISVVNEPLYYYQYNKQSLSNRYRANLWNKLSALLSVKKSALQKFGSAEKDGKRLTNETIKCIKISILNLGKGECNLSFREKKNSLKAIRNDKNAALAFAPAATKETDLKTKLAFLLLKYRFYNLILISQECFS